MARAGKLKLMGGRMVSAKSKTGDPACSQAASAWQNSLRGNPVGMALSTAMQVLAQCRAKARALKQAGGHRSAGNELRAQALESRIAKGGPLTAKDRLAKARELRGNRKATLMEKQAVRDYGRNPALAEAGFAAAKRVRAEGRSQPADVKTLAAKAAAHNRLYNEGGEGFNPHADALAKAKAAEHQKWRGDFEAKWKVKNDRLIRYADSLRVQGNPAAVKAFQLEGRKPGSPLAGTSGARIAQNRAAVAKALRAKDQDVMAKWREARARRAAARPAQPTAKPLHEQALEAARRVPSEKRFGSKVFVHHAWQEYRKGGGKLGLSEFKAQLVGSPEARMNMSRADLVQGMRRGDVKGSNVAYMGGEYNFIKVGEAGSGRVGAKIQPRPESSYHGKPPAAEKSRAADIVARARAMRAPKVSSLKEQAAAHRAKVELSLQKMSEVGRGGFTVTDRKPPTMEEGKSLRLDQARALVSTRLNTARRHRDKKAIKRLESHQATLGKIKMSLNASR